MYSEKNEELQHKMTEMGESNRVITQVSMAVYISWPHRSLTAYPYQAMRLKQEELNEINVKYDNLVKELHLLRDGNK